MISLVKVLIIPLVLGAAWMWYYNTYKKPEEMQAIQTRKDAYKKCLAKANDNRKNVLGCNTDYADVVFANEEKK